MTTDCTYTNSGEPAILVSSHCETTGSLNVATTSVQLVAPVGVDFTQLAVVGAIFLGLMTFWVMLSLTKK